MSFINSLVYPIVVVSQKHGSITIQYATEFAIWNSCENIPDMIVAVAAQKEVLDAQHKSDLVEKAQQIENEHNKKKFVDSIAQHIALLKLESDIAMCPIKIDAKYYKDIYELARFEIMLRKLNC